MKNGGLNKRHQRRLLVRVVFFGLMCVCGSLSVKASGVYQYQMPVRNWTARETGVNPQAYLYIPEGVEHVRAVIFSIHNMTEQTMLSKPLFRQELKRLGVAFLWVSPSFSANWDPHSGCQAAFTDLLHDLACVSGHNEIEAHSAIIPLGHSAHATFPWNFAAWNNDRTLCVVSFKGDAPRTNMCGYGGANIEWGRTRNIDGIPGLMVEGEYEWSEDRVLPAMAFRMMYPKSCLSFLCDAGRGHFDCSDETALYVTLFIEKALAYRGGALHKGGDGRLLPVNPEDGVLAERWYGEYNALPATDRQRQWGMNHPAAAPYREYEGDKHEAFWYFDMEMAQVTEQFYRRSIGKRVQYVGHRYNGHLVPYDDKIHGGMRITVEPDGSGRFVVVPEYTDSTHVASSAAHSSSPLRMEVICGPVRQINDTTFILDHSVPGTDNPRRQNEVWLLCVSDGDENYKSAVQPLEVVIGDRNTVKKQ